jgi:hypothetical protein
MAQREPLGRLALVGGLLAVASVQCGGNSLHDGEPISTQSQPIIGGSLVDGPGAPVLLLHGPEGDCSAPLVAPNLIVTTRHCVAHNTMGAFGCSAQGDLVPNVTGAGQIGANDDPGSIQVFTPERVAANMYVNTTPDAVGVLIQSTDTPTACRDDIAFVVLNQPIPGRSILPIRLGPTQVGEPVMISGFGLTDKLGDLEALRSRSDQQVIAIGPGQPPTVTQPAPLRSVRVGPAAVTCNGDSGGPVQSLATGALIAISSLGLQAASQGPYCQGSQSATSDTIGPRLAEYPDLVASAFQAAGQTPILEQEQVGAEQEQEGSADDAASGPDVGAAEGPSVTSYSVESGSCNVGPCNVGPVSKGSAFPYLSAWALAIGAIARRSRRGGPRRPARVRSLFH